MNDSQFKNALYRTLRGKPTPLFVFEDRVIPAASVWSGARQWLNAMRAAGVSRGDRIVLAIEPSPAWLMVAIACFWDGCTLALISPGEDLRESAESVHATLTIARKHNKPDRAGLPPKRLACNKSATPRTEDIALLMRTSGSTGKPRWVALSQDNIDAVIESHAPLVHDRPRTVLSVLPWHHAFGLVIDLLPAILAECTIVRDCSAGRDIDAVLRLARHYDCNATCLVPMQVRQLVDREDGRQFLRRVETGVVGGAPIDADSAEFLRATSIRPGYGLTEASPGIALGSPTDWTQGAMGTPIGCETMLDADGQLWFKGRNACLGEFRDGKLIPAPSGWRPTGDLAEPRPTGGLRFLGRIDNDFKLGNGRMVRAAALERTLQHDFPIESATIVPHSDDTIAIYIVPAPNTARPTTDSIREHLGSLGSRVRRVTYTHASDLPRTTKGDIDRKALASPSHITRVALAA